MNAFNLQAYQQQQQATHQAIQAQQAAAAVAAAVQQQQQHQQQQQLPCDGLVVHGSTPLSQIGANLGCSVPPSESSGPLSPALTTTPGGSGDECDSDFASRSTYRKQKRGVLPKQATSVMRSWLFQHLVVSYPYKNDFYLLYSE